MPLVLEQKVCQLPILVLSSSLKPTWWCPRGSPLKIEDISPLIAPLEVTVKTVACNALTAPLVFLSWAPSGLMIQENHWILKLLFEFFPDNRGWSFTCLRFQAESYNVVEYVIFMLFGYNSPE